MSLKTVVEPSKTRLIETVLGTFKEAHKRLFE